MPWYIGVFITEGQSMTPKSRSLSASTVYTDSEPDRPSSTLTDDSLGSHRPLGRDDDDSSQTLPLASGDADVNFLLTKVSKANDNMRQEAESMLLAADEVSDVHTVGFEYECIWGFAVVASVWLINHCGDICCSFCVCELFCCVFACFV